MKNYKLKINGNEYAVEIKNIEDNIASVVVNGADYSVEVEGMASKPKTPRVVVNPTVATPGSAVTSSPAATASATASAGAGAINSPLPGVILDVYVKEGDSVTVGQKLMSLEAMKMENNIESDRAGVVKSIPARKGDSVLEGDVLITIG